MYSKKDCKPVAVGSGICNEYRNPWKIPHNCRLINLHFEFLWVLSFSKRGQKLTMTHKPIKLTSCPLFVQIHNCYLLELQQKYLINLPVNSQWSGKNMKSCLGLIVTYSGLGFCFLSVISDWLLNISFGSFILARVSNHIIRIVISMVTTCSSSST